MNKSAKPTLARPNFGGARAARFLDPAILPDDTREELFEIAEHHTGKRAARGFIAACEREAQITLWSRRTIKPSEERDQLLQTADSARSLLLAMQRLRPDVIASLKVHEKHPLSQSPNSPIRWPEFAVATVQPMRREGGLLACSWDLVDALERTARHAAAQVRTADKKGPEARSAAALARALVAAYFQYFDKLPSPDQNGWFVAFAQRLGKEFDLQCGPRPVRNAITEHGLHRRSVFR